MATKLFTFRLNSVKDKAIWDDVHAQIKAGFDLRKIVSDRFSRYLGITPEMFHQESRSLTAAEMQDLVETALNPFEAQLVKIEEKIDQQSDQFHASLEEHKSSLRQLIQQVGAGGLSVEQALEELDDAVDSYTTNLIQSQGSRYD